MPKNYKVPATVSPAARFLTVLVAQERGWIPGSLVFRPAHRHREKATTGPEGQKEARRFATFGLNFVTIQTGVF